MDCSTCGKLLALYAGGDLDADEAREVEGHLSACETCRAEFDALKGTIALLGTVSVREEDLPARDETYWLELDSKLRERALDVEHLSAAGSWWLRTSRLLAQAAVVLIAAGVVVHFSMFGQGPSQEPVRKTVLTHERPKSRRPVIVVIQTPASRDRGEFTTVSAEDNGVDFSDFGSIRRSGELRRLQDAVIPAVADDEPF